MQWKQHPYFVDYAISDTGQVRRLTRGQATRIGRISKGTRDADGYIVYSLSLPCISGERKKSRLCKAARLVLEAFVGPAPTNRHQAAHGNNDKSCNEWSSVFN